MIHVAEAAESCAATRIGCAGNLGNIGEILSDAVPILAQADGKYALVCGLVRFTLVIFADVHY